LKSIYQFLIFTAEKMTIKPTIKKPTQIH